MKLATSPSPTPPKLRLPKGIVSRPSPLGFLELTLIPLGPDPEARVAVSGQYAQPSTVSPGEWSWAQLVFPPVVQGER